MGNMLGLSSNPRKGERVNATGTSPGADLSPELIYEVLSRLPAISIGRFRCACKQWHTLLYDPQFLKLQFRRNRFHNKLIFRLDSSPVSNSLICFVDFRKGCYSNGDKDVVAVGKLLNFKNCGWSYKILGSCNGLLLLYDYIRHNLSIVNPVTRETRRLPSCPERIYAGDGYAFGYDSCNDDYMVVILLRGIHRGSHHHRGTACVFKRNSWKLIENFPFYLVGSPVVSINGTIYWLGYRNYVDEFRVIFEFDFADEKLGEVEQPKCFKEENRLIMDVNVLGGCLYLFVSKGNWHSRNSMEIWTMKEEYGVRQSWTKFLVFQSLDCYTKPLYLWDGHDAFMVMMNQKKLVLCNLREGKSKEIDIQGQRPTPEYPTSYYSQWSFVDSLVSPNSIRT